MNTNPTQSTAILKHLQSGNKLTGLDALHLFGCIRLGARIWELKRNGYNIKTERAKVGKKTVARYFL